MGGSRVVGVGGATSWEWTGSAKGGLSLVGLMWLGRRPFREGCGRVEHYCGEGSGRSRVVVAFVFERCTVRAVRVVNGLEVD